MDKKNIVIVPAWYPSTSDPLAGIFVQQQAKALLDGELKISVFFVEETHVPGAALFNRTQYNLEQGIPTYRIRTFVPPKRIRVLRFWWFKQWDRLINAFYEKHGSYPDLLHAHSFVGGAAARYLGGKYDIPYLITEHYSGFMSGDIPTHWRGDLGDIYQDAVKVIAVSPALAKALENYCSEIIVVPNMIDTSIFKPRPGAEISGITRRLITVGSLISRKNHASLLHIFAKLSQRFSLELTIIGAGPMFNELQGLAKSLKIDKVVNFTGPISPAEVARQLQSADLYVSTSSTESFALAPVEALASGLPVVILRCGSILENESFKGVEVVNDLSEIEIAIRKQLQLLEEIERQALHDQIKIIFTPVTITSQIHELYRSFF